MLCLTDAHQRQHDATGSGQAVIMAENSFDVRISQIAERGLEPAERETYANGVRKATFRDPDGNEIGFGGDLA